MLVLAGPGSGKTTVITGRVQYLLTRQNVSPEQLLVITFTKAAATEMRQRFELLTRKEHPPVVFSTFHAVFFQILRYAYNYSAASILRESEAMRILTDILGRLDPALAKELDLVLSVLHDIALYKGNHCPLFKEEKASAPRGICPPEVFFAALHEYERTLRKQRRLDFEDMLLLTYDLLTKRPDILSFWQNRFHYILIDEFQDVNRLQYEIVRLLAAPQNNLFVVGDDDQAIYGFRGSRPELMLQFPVDYPNAKTVLLNINYRSPAPVLQAALRLISVNKKRYPKALIARRQEGEPVHIHQFASCAEENHFLIQHVRELQKKNTPLSQIAVLYRTNSQPRVLVQALREAEIPYVLHGKLPCLYDNAHVAPVLSYLRLAVGGRHRTDALQIANKPVRYIKRQAFPSEIVDFDAARQWYLNQDKGYVAERIARLQYDLCMIGKTDPYAAIHYIRNIVGYDEFLQTTLHSSDTAFDLLDEVMEEAGRFSTIPAFLDYTAHVQKREKENATRTTQNKDGVALMTFHASKGLEFPYVFVIDCNETLLPHKRNLLPEQICEERRLLYVAMTRTKEVLHLFSVKKKFGKELAVSRFLKEIQD